MLFLNFKGGISESPALWNLEHSVTKYIPPNFSEFSFGVPRALFHGLEPATIFYQRHQSGMTDKVCICFDYLVPTFLKMGRHALQLEFVGKPQFPAPVKVSAECTVMDINNQALVTSQSFLVHPSPIYIGIWHSL